MARKKLTRLQDDYDLARVLEDYPDLDTALAEQRRNGATLKELQAYVNRAIASAAVTGTDIASDRVYRLLSSDTPSRQEYTALRQALQTYDIDLDQIDRDFISHEGVRSYLQDELEVTPESDPLTASDALANIEPAEERYANIIRYQLEQLADDQPDFTLGDGISIEIDVDIVCQGTGDIHSLRRFLDSSGCRQ